MIELPSVERVGLVTSETEREAVFRLRYEVYVEELGRDRDVADNARRRLRDRLDRDDARIYAAFAGGRAVATVRTNYLRDGEVGEYEEHYALRELSGRERWASSITTRLMVAPAYRRSPVTSALCRAIYRDGMAMGIESNYVDCDPRHEPFFSALGFRVVRQGFHHERYGEGKVMRLDVLDYEHLERVRSPFRRDLRAHLRSLGSPGEVSRA